MLRIVRPNDAGQVPRPPKNAKPCLTLTEEEAARLRVVPRNLRRHFGTWACLAEVMGVGVSTLIKIAGGRLRGSPGVLLQAARVAGMPVERIVSTALSVVNTCPTCGRST